MAKINPADVSAMSQEQLDQPRHLRKPFGGKIQRVKDADGLLPKERMFVEEYLVSLNATASCILAGYAPKHATSIGSDLLRRPHIARAVERAKRARLARLRIRQDEALLELRALVTSDLDHYRRAGDRIVVRDGVEPMQSEEGDVSIPRTRALSKIKLKSKTYMDENDTMVTEHETELAVHSKTAALDMYLKHLGMFPTGARLEIESDDNTLVIQEVVE